MIKNKSVLRMLYVVVLLLVFHAVPASFRDEEERCDIFYDRRMTHYFNFTQKGLRHAQFYVASMEEGIVPSSSNSIYFVDQKFDRDLGRLIIIFEEYLTKLEIEVKLNTPYEDCFNRFKSSQCKSTPPVKMFCAHKIRYVKYLTQVIAYSKNNYIKGTDKRGVLKPSQDLKEASLFIHVVCSNCTFIIYSINYPEDIPLPALNMAYYPAVICSVSTIHQDNSTEKTTDIACVSAFENLENHLQNNFQMIKLYDRCGAPLRDYYLVENVFYPLLLESMDDSTFNFTQPNNKNLTLLAPPAYPYSNESYTLTVYLQNYHFIELEKMKRNKSTMFYYVGFSLRKYVCCVSESDLLLPITCDKFTIFTDGSRIAERENNPIYLSFFCGKDFITQCATQVEVIIEPKMKEFGEERFSVPFKSNSNQV